MAKTNNYIDPSATEVVRAIIVATHAPRGRLQDGDASVEELKALLSGLAIDVISIVGQKRPSGGTLGAGRLDELRELVGVNLPKDDSDLTPDTASTQSFDDWVDSFDDDARGGEVYERVDVALDAEAAEPEAETQPLGQDADGVEDETTPDDASGSGVEQEAPGVDLVVFDGELSPGEARRMRRALGVPVLDRTQLILRVFHERAQTREAQLEVELAQLQYEAPRVRDDEKNRGRVGGGGRGGRGDTNVALTKQRIEQRCAILRRQLQEVHSARIAQKARRAETFRVALVGYTNAGKSSLMRALTGSPVLVEDKLFATLGTTVRALQPETVPRILISDTVGFIRNLPHDLIASFRATLAEAHEADLLLYVVDAADEECSAQLDVTRDVIDELGAGEVPSRIVLNKVDRIDGDTKRRLHESLPDAVFTSAHDPDAVEELKQLIQTYFDQRLLDASVALPYTDMALTARIRREARVLSERFTADGVDLTLRCSDVALSRLERLLGDRIVRDDTGHGARSHRPGASKGPD